MQGLCGGHNSKRPLYKRLMLDWHHSLAARCDQDRRVRLLASEGRGSGETAGRPPNSAKASVICSSATALSNGVAGMSPQSTMVAQSWYGLMPARWLKPRNDVWRPDACRMARGPKRAPMRNAGPRQHGVWLYAGDVPGWGAAAG